MNEKEKILLELKKLTKNRQCYLVKEKLNNIDKKIKEHIVAKDNMESVLDIPSNLTQAANDNGGGDNITSILIEVNMN